MATVPNYSTKTLVHFYLDHNLIRHIDKTSFSKYYNLKNVYLSEKLIEEIESNSFRWT